MSSSADLLRRAAVKLRERAELAQRGPWHIGNAVDPTKPCNVHTFPTSRLVAAEVPWLDAEYIATLHPPVALALADLLNLQAVDIANAVAAWERDPSYIDKFLGGVKAHAENVFALQFALARAILREPEETRDA